MILIMINHLILARSLAIIQLTILSIQTCLTIFLKISCKIKTDEKLNLMVYQPAAKFHKQETNRNIINQIVFCTVHRMSGIRMQKTQVQIPDSDY